MRTRKGSKRDILHGVSVDKVKGFWLHHLETNLRKEHKVQLKSTCQKSSETSQGFEVEAIFLECLAYSKRLAVLTSIDTQQVLRLARTNTLHGALVYVL